MGLFGKMWNATQRSRLDFAVIDLETTGLDPRQDRIVEIAVVQVDGSRRITNEWTTLVNPGDGDSGPTKIHGIEDRWLAAAPTFADIVGDLREQLTGRILTAHNVQFDTDFLEHELGRAGANTEVGLQMLDTMDITTALDLPRSLRNACQALGITYNPHTALEDARATAKLLTSLMKRVDPSTFNGSPVVQRGWIPEHINATGSVCLRGDAAQLTTPRDIVAGAVFSLPPQTAGDERDLIDFATYRQRVVEVLDDGYVSPDENSELISVAASLAMGPDDVRRVHHDVFLGLLDNALADRRISKAERAELEHNAQWLGVDLADWDALVKAGRARLKHARADFRVTMTGTSVCFAGRGIHPNNVRKALCIKNDITFQTAVTGNTTMLVVGSVDAKGASVDAARDRNLPTIDEAEFWQRLGEL